MPHLMNCDHLDSGWCLDCVKKLHDKSEERFSNFRDFAERLLNPEDMGFAVSGYVRDEARVLLGLPRCEQVR